jgi:hypothetical protein
MKLITQILALFILGTCQSWAADADETTIDWGSTEAIKGLIELNLHPTHGEVSYGPNFAKSDRTLLKNFSEIYLARVVAPDDEESYTIFITVVHNDDDLRTYKTATKKDGQKLSMATLTTNENVSSDNMTYKYEERLAVSMHFVDFADAAFSTSPFEVTISGNKTDVIKIPNGYFLAMMQSM